MPVSFSKKTWTSEGLEEYHSVQDQSEERPSESDDSISSDNTLLEKQIHLPRQNGSYYSKHSRLILLNGAVFVFYIVSILFLTRHFHDRLIKGPDLIHSPAYSAITWHEQAYNETDTAHGPFSGYPRPEVDNNWHELLTGEW
ncbi:Tat pathway signal sequence protein [Rutstroemia sp. NJR-2017a BBW]|nr:Tat pathway signal sequence protein [Rutstroemia sp. NJR-2017a BBW]